MKTRAEAIQYCMTLSDVYEDYPFRDTNWTVMRHTSNKKYLPGTLKKKENSIILDGTIPVKDICRMVAESYDLTNTKKKAPHHLTIRG